MFYCTKFGEELKFKAHYGSPLGYPFWIKKIQDHEKNKKKGKQRKKKKRRKAKRKEESVGLNRIVSYL